MSDQDQAFVGRCGVCGRLHAAVVVRLATAGEVGRAVKDMERDGLTIEQMTVGEARPQLDLHGCQEVVA